MLEKIKEHLRITHDLLNDDIQDVIEECLHDLRRMDVRVIETDPLIVASVKLYARYRFNFEDQGERYMKAYEDLRNALSFAIEYGVDTEPEADHE